jgi:hypothetical protein
MLAPGCRPQPFYTSPLHAAKSTPSLVAALTPESSLKSAATSYQQKWMMNSVDSLDTVSTLSSGLPNLKPEEEEEEVIPHQSSGDAPDSNWAEEPESSQSTVSPKVTGDSWKQEAGNLNVTGDVLDDLNVPKRSTSMSSGSTTTSSNHHSHSHSDSGLSSLSHGGRTSTMSPVSTMSTVSSVSTSSSGAQQQSGSSAGSSRASLRSASIVSSTQSPPESLKEEEAVEDEAEAEAANNIDGASGPGSGLRDFGNSCPAEFFERGSNDSGTGTLKKGFAPSRKYNKLQEELDCEELSRQLFNDGSDYKMQSLFGELAMQNKFAKLVLSIDSSKVINLN